MCRERSHLNDVFIVHELKITNDVGENFTTNTTKFSKKKLYFWSIAYDTANPAGKILKIKGYSVGGPIDYICSNYNMIH